MIFDELVRKQKSLRQIARMLNDQQVPTPRGGRRWNGSGIQQIVLNPAYMGKAAFGKTVRISRHREHRNRAIVNTQIGAS